MISIKLSMLSAVVLHSSLWTIWFRVWIFTAF